MSRAADPAPPSVWRILRMRARDTVEAALARGDERVTFALAALTTALAILADVSIDLGLPLSLAAPRDALGFAALAALGALAGAVLLFVDGWLVDAIARLFGGMGSVRAARAALAWGPAPMIVGAALALVLRATTQGSAAAAAWVVEIPFALWAVARVSTMLAKTHGFGRVRGFAAAYVAPLALAAIFAFVVRALLLQPFAVASGSMAPGLLVGDDVFATKTAYGYTRHSFPFELIPFEGRVLARMPQRGDVIAFVRDDETVYLKRVVGLPGDTVQMVGGRLTLNSALVERRPAAPEPMRDGLGKAIEAPAWDETLPGGASYRIVQIDGDAGRLSNTRVFAVPEGAVFVLGDNRDNSLDSRLGVEERGFGFVPFERIVGRVSLVYWSVDRGGATPRVRWERIGRMAH